MPPHLTGGQVLRWQERCERALQSVRVAADGVCSVAVVGALAVETQVIGRRHEEGLQQFSVSEGVQLRGHVEHTACDGHRAPETQQPAAHNTIPS